MYDTLKIDSKKGDFLDFVSKDIKEVDLKISDEKIKTIT